LSRRDNNKEKKEENKMTNWNEEFKRLAEYEQSRREKEIMEQAQREMIVKSAFRKMMDAYTIIRRAGYDVQAKVFDTEWGDYEWQPIQALDIFQVETT
jgi:hypothetical protein